MKRWWILLIFLVVPIAVSAEQESVYYIIKSDGTALTEICYQPETGDEYIAGDNMLYRIVSVDGSTAVAQAQSPVTLPSVQWLDAEMAVPVSSVSRHIALYCTHSDECYEPSDGHYTTNERGSIYQIAKVLADELSLKGVDATVSDRLHHPHDAGAYRRSRQTAIELIKAAFLPDALIDVHRDGIPDPASYAVEIGGKEGSKIRLLVGRGNQNAELNKEFALMIKAVADRVYPGLIKDIYMGKGTFNQDLLPHSILLECGTYTLEKERVLTSMPMMADVLNRALYGGIVGSAGRIISDVNPTAQNKGNIVLGEADASAGSSEGTGSGFGFLGTLMIIVLLGGAILAAGSLKRGVHKAGRNLSEMTGGLIGTKPSKDEDPEHS